MRKRNCRGTFPSRGNPMCMILCLTFRRANSMLEMTNNERNVRIVKKLLSAVLCMLTLLTLVGCGQSGAITENSAAKLQTVTQHGVACYRVYGVQYPAVFGEPELTEAELSDLLDGGDPTEMARTVNTVPDALRLLRLRQQNSEDIDNQNAEGTLLRGGNQPYGWVQAMLYLLCGDYEDSGRIDLLAPDDYYAFCAIEQDGLYYAFDPFQIRGNSWISLSGEGYADADVQKVADALRENCDYSAFTKGRYVVNTYTLPDKETWKRNKAFKQREYTDEEIQQLANAGLTLEEAADKLHTIEDAALFLQASGYRIDNEDPHLEQGRYVNFSLNPSCYIDGYDWSWGLPADYTYEHMAGTCNGTSNLMNRLLAGDYEEQGYVGYCGSHIFNYIKQNGYYYFCDFANCQLFCNTGLDYLMYACQDPLEFKGYYCATVFPGWDDPEDDDYLVLMYLYPRDGKDSLPRGSSGEYNDLTGGRTYDIISSEAADTVIILYQRDWYHYRFMDVDPTAIPEVCEDIIDGAMHTVNWRTGEVLD